MAKEAVIEELIPGEVLLVRTSNLHDTFGRLKDKYRVKSIAPVINEFRARGTEGYRYNLLCCVELKCVGGIRKYSDSGKISRDELYNIIESVMGIPREDVTNEAHLLDWGDSIDLVELVMALEEELEIEISDRAAEQPSTVGDVVELLKSQDLFVEEHPQAAATQ